MPNNKKIHIFGGGTFSHVRNHLALAAPAFGTAAIAIEEHFEQWLENNGLEGKMDIELHLTRMAGGGVLTEGRIVTNEDLMREVDKVVEDLDTKIVVMSCAVADFEGHLNTTGWDDAVGKHAPRLDSSLEYTLRLRRAPKIIDRIRRDKRKDIFLVAFKTTTNASGDEQFKAALSMMKRSSCNLVVANDVVTRRCFIVTPEEVRYADKVYDDGRAELWRELVDMTMLRSQLTFTRSTVVDGEPIAWDSHLVPDSLRKIVDYCIERGAYKPGPTGATVGHFAVKLDDTTFLTSRRKTNFNRMSEVGLVKITTDGPDSVIAYGSKPSVGGQSQRIVFEEHEDTDCIVHFHCPLREDALDRDVIPVVSQREYECGSHECGQNTSRGLERVWGSIRCVMLDKHGPNIVFHRDIDAGEVIRFIERNFDLEAKTT